MENRDLYLRWDSKHVVMCQELCTDEKRNQVSEHKRINANLFPVWPDQGQCSLVHKSHFLWPCCTKDLIASSCICKIIILLKYMFIFILDALKSQIDRWWNVITVVSHIKCFCDVYVFVAVLWRFLPYKNLAHSVCNKFCLATYF